MTHYHHSDFMYEEHVRACKRMAAEPHCFYEYTSNCTGEVWNSFFEANTGDAYKDRNYVREEFLSHLQSPVRLRILEVGCGCGNTALPLVQEMIKEGPGVDFVATDISPVAISKLMRRKGDLKVEAFKWDVLEPLPTLSQGSFDIVLCIFALSAVHPDSHLTAISNMLALLRPGGKLLFRDYAEYDMTMFRKQFALGPQLFLRNDNTLAFYFTPDYMQLLATRSALTVVENEVCCIINKNRKNGVALKRCFQHLVLQRPNISGACCIDITSKLEYSGCRHIMDPIFPHADSQLQMKHLVRLDWSIQKMKSSSSEFLISSPSWSLNLRGKQPKMEILKCVEKCQSETFRNELLHMELSHGAAKDANLLFQTGRFPSLLHLNLQGDRSASCISSFLKWADHFSSLRSLNLCGCPIDGPLSEEIIVYIQSCQHSLRQLNLRACSICALGGEKSYLGIAKAALATGINVIDLSEERRNSENGLFELTKIVEISSVMTLVLDKTSNISEAVAFALGSAMGESTLSRLSLSECRLGNKELKSLCDGIKHSSQRRLCSKSVSLSLEFNDFDDSSPLHDLIYGLTSARLVWLNIRGNRICPRIQNCLAGRIACSPWLFHADLENCSLTQEFFFVLIARLRLNWNRKTNQRSSLATLNFAENSMGFRAVKSFFELLSEFSTHQPIRCLFLGRCYPGVLGIEAISNFLAKNDRLICLGMIRSEFLINLEGTSTLLHRPLCHIPLPFPMKMAFLCSLRFRTWRKGNCFLNEDVLRHVFLFLRSELVLRLDLH